jgi:hypothetical protein
MNIQVNKHQLERVVIKWLNKNFGNLTLKHKKGVNINRSFYVNKDNLVIMESYNATKVIFVHPLIIFNPIMTMFHLSRNEVYHVIEKWLKERTFIGQIGNSGGSFGIHLHYGIYRVDENCNKLNINMNDKTCIKGAVNPLPYLND